MTRGILEAHAAGVVTSASLLVNTPGYSEAARAAVATPGLGIGLHFNLTAGAPVSSPDRVASLCRSDGAFCSFRVLVRRAFTGRIRTDQVTRECLAQLARLTDRGLRVTHIDSHRHAHALPGVWPGVLTAAREAGIAVVRVPVEPPGGRRAVPKVLIALSWRWSARGTRLPLAPPHFRGLGLLGSARFGPEFLALVDALPSGVSELMVHPGYADPVQAAWDPYGAPREAELEALRSPAVRERLARSDLQLIHFGDL